MFRSTRGLWLATLVAVLGAAEVAKAQLIPTYWTTNGDTAKDKPSPTPPHNGWTQGNVVGPIAPGQTVWVAFLNKKDITRQKSFGLSRQKIAGPIFALSFQSIPETQDIKGFWGDDEDSKTVKFHNVAYIPLDNGQGSFRVFQWAACPEWERFRLKNNDATRAVTARILGSSSCKKLKRKGRNNMRIQDGHLGEPNALPGDFQINELLYFPLQRQVDSNITPSFSAPPSTGNWNFEFVNQDPAGNTRPQGGVRFFTNGPGITAGDEFDLDFGMFGEADSIYEVFLFDTVLNDYQATFLETDPPWFEHFDPRLYLPGQGLHLTRGWQGWGGNPAQDGLINDQVFQSPPFSVEVQGQSDLVRTFQNVDAGAWLFSCWMFIPQDFQTPNQNDPMAGTHFVLVNTYETGEPNYNWSVDLQFDPRVGQLKVYHGNGNNTIDVPYIVDQWVPIDVVVDLDNDFTQIFYDQQLITEYSWTAGWDGTGGGKPQIAAVDLWPNGSSPVFYDDMMLVPIREPVKVDDYTVHFGAYAAGDVESVRSSDDEYLFIDQRPAFTPLLPLIRVDFDATANALDANRLFVTVETGTNAIPTQPPQKLSGFNFDLSNWEVIDEDLTTLGDTVVNAMIETNAGRFIGDDGAMRWRLEWFDPGNVFSPAWNTRTDIVIGGIEH